jgi:ABC-2 type transport system permease protein
MSISVIEAPETPALPADETGGVLNRAALRARTHGLVFVALLKMHFIEARRYLLDTVMQLVLGFVFFLTLFTGVRLVGGAEATSGGNLGAIVVGMIVWLSALRAFRGVSGRLGSEASQGTLEQLAMCPVGLGTALLYQSLVQFTIQIVQVGVLLTIIMASTGKWLHVPLISILPLLFLTVAGAQGIGFAMGGMSLVFKRVSSVFLLFQYIFIGLVAIPVSAHPVMRWLPLSWGAHLIRKVMVEGATLWTLPAGSVLLLVANTAVWFGLGFGVYKAFEGAARERGLLGHY